MQRKATKQSRGPNSLELEQMRWIKERQQCAACGVCGPVICHHMYGSAAKKKVGLVTVIIGPAAVIGLCQSCDDIVTHGSRRAFTDKFGPQNKLWAAQYREWGKTLPDEVVMGIMAYESAFFA